jgi:YidC/Oxa1 family membrane protein insertase
MIENRNTILAVILSGLVLIAWQYFYNVPQMERQRAQIALQNELAKPATQAESAATPQTGPASAPAVNQPASAAPAVSRDSAIAATPRIRIDTPRLSGSISLRGARIDDLSLVQFRETVNPASPAIVLFSPSGTAEPYYAEFGWVAASGSTVRIPDQNTLWQQEGSNRCDRRTLSVHREG